MLKKIFGHKNKDSVFIESYPNRDKYFARTKPWDWLNEKEIYVAGKVDGKPKMITFEFWPQEIYLDANGKITVRQLIDVAKQQYLDSNMSIPKELDKIIIECLDSLVHELKIVEFSDNKINLRPEIEKPMSRPKADTD